MDGKGITLITPEEVNVYRLGDSVIYYARVPTGEQNRMLAAIGARRDGAHLGEFNKKLLVRAIKGWSGLADPSGKVPAEHDPVAPPDRAVLTVLVDRLPGQVIADLANLTTDAKGAEDELLKN